jgi:hypothetical protein
MDLTGLYNLTPRGNRYLVTFVDRFTRYVEAYPISSQSAEERACVYAAHIVTRHGTGSKLITDQGRNFVIIFSREYRGYTPLVGIPKVTDVRNVFIAHYTQGFLIS